MDAAVELAPPDEEGRRRLFRPYGSGCGVDQLRDEELAPACRSTEGRTATYVREVVRRAAMRAAFADASGPVQVTGDLLAEAADGLLADRAALTRSLLGGPVEPDAEPPLSGGPPRPFGWRGYAPRMQGEPPKPFGSGLEGVRHPDRRSWVARRGVRTPKGRCRRRLARTFCPAPPAGEGPCWSGRGAAQVLASAVRW